MDQCHSRKSRERNINGIAAPVRGKWFTEQKASRICVNVDPANIAARRFYTRHGAEKLNENWLVWKDISVVLGERLDVG